MIVLLAVMLTLSSCVLQDATSRDDSLGKHRIAYHVVQVFNYAYDYAPFALYAELALSGRASEATVVKSHYFDKAIITIEESKVLFKIPNNSYYNTLQLITEGEQLSDGAVWKLLSSGSEPVATFVGFDGVDDEFIIHYKRNNYQSGQMEAYALMDCEVNPSSRKITTRILGEGRMEKESSFRVDFGIDEDCPLVRFTPRDSYEDGRIYMVYKDLVTSKSKTFSATLLPGGEFRYE